MLHPTHLTFSINAQWDFLFKVYQSKYQNLPIHTHFQCLHEDPSTTISTLTSSKHLASRAPAARSSVGKAILHTKTLRSTNGKHSSSRASYAQAGEMPFVPLHAAATEWPPQRSPPSVRGSVGQTTVLQIIMTGIERYGSNIS